MKISILGGKDEIGGNKVLLEHKGTRVLLDFGMSFKQVSKYFCEFLQPRKGSALLDFFEFGLLPDIKGTYRPDYLKHSERPNEEKNIDAIFLSHAHVDHAQYIHFLRHDIPVYCTKPTHIILKALEETGSGRCDDLVTCCESFTFYQNTRGELSRVTSRNIDYLKERTFNIMQAEKPVQIGSLKIEMVPVDHSLPGACAFIVHSDEGNLVYTGDIRFHGYHNDLSRKFVEKAKAASPRWLLCEGTRIKEKKGDSEEKVRKNISKYISKAKGIVFVEHPIRDSDRVYTMFLAAKDNNREFVVNLKLAYLLEALGELSPVKLDEVKIFIPRKSWGANNKRECLSKANRAGL